MHPVRRFTDSSHMKFRPKVNHPLRLVKKTAPEQLTGIVGKAMAFVRAITAPASSTNPNVNVNGSSFSAQKSGGKNNSGNRQNNWSKDDGKGANDAMLLKFLYKIGDEMFLLGNQNQLDMLTISVIGGMIDTDFNWSFSLKTPIDQLALDVKKCNIAVLSLNSLLVYSYDLKQIKQAPKLVCQIALTQTVQSILFLKESLLAAFGKKQLTVYQISDSNKLKMIFRQAYPTRPDLSLMQVPQPIEQLINLFFVQPNSSNGLFGLWRLEMHFRDNTPSWGVQTKVYDFKSSLQKKFSVQYYSRDIYLINFQYEIMAVKDGYLMDSVTISIREGKSILVYLPDRNYENLLHVQERTVQLYDFKLQTNTKPNKIAIKSIDSIQTRQLPKFIYFGCLEMLRDNFMLIYQMCPSHNPKVGGEIDYLISVTQKQSVEEKLDEIFNFDNGDELSRLSKPENFHLIQEKCDMAFKIGLSRKQVYLQLWNRSNKRSVGDFKFLLDTFDYETIRKQIQKKLKKSSMLFNEVYKIEQSCFDMLAEKMESETECTQEVIRNFISSHFLLRKLALFRDIEILRRFDSQCEQAHSKLEDSIRIKSGSIPSSAMATSKTMINIQQYSYYLKMELKSQLLDYIAKFCEEGKDFSLHIRAFIRAFRFPLRIIYKSFLQQMVVVAKGRLLALLKAVPELLPYQHSLDGNVDSSLYEGIWGEIRKEEWKNSLHMQAITTIYNKDALHEVSQSVWFKRNLYTQHDLIFLKKQEIKEVHESNKSETIFYIFVEEFFTSIKDEAELHELVTHLEANYLQMPQHLKGKIFLYRNLFRYFDSGSQTLPGIRQLHEFLRLKDYEVFKALFDREKTRKGCLLKEAKKIYEETCPTGAAIYNQGLLNYFASDLSKISDLKYILNRLNNEKREFHQANEAMYEVLVKGMQMKIRLGSDNDVPIEDVIIYIDNIPFSKTNRIIQELGTIQHISEEATRFQAMRINMSIRQIIDNCEDVITALIDSEIANKHVLSVRDQEKFKALSYDILADVQTIKEKIYKQQYTNLTFFLYLCKIMQSKAMVPFAAMLLNDQYLIDSFEVDATIVEHLVLYMYKWKFSKCRSFVENEKYLREILLLLEPTSEWRLLIECELEFALMLSTPEHPLEYPLVDTSSVSETIFIMEIEEIINTLSGDFLIGLDLHRLHKIITKMQQLSSDNEKTQLSEIYEVVILRLIELRRLKEVIPRLRQLITSYAGSNHYSVAYCVIIGYHIMGELSELHRTYLTKIFFYGFNDVQLLLKILETMMTTKFSNLQEKNYLQEQMQQVTKSNKCYDPNNMMLSKQLLKSVTEANQKAFEKMVYQCCQHVNRSREEYERNPEFTMIYIMLVQNPYVLAKYIYFRRKIVNVKIIRSYLSYIIREDIFDSLNVLEFAKRMFHVVLQAIRTLEPLEQVASQYKDIPLDEEAEFVEFVDDQLQSNIEIKLKKSIKAFEKKIASIKEEMTSSIQKDAERQKQKRIHQLLNQQAPVDKKVSQYPFSDSDDNVEQNDEECNQRQKKKQHEVEQFHPSKERNMIMSLVVKNLILVNSDKAEIIMNRRRSRSKRGSFIVRSKRFFDESDMQKIIKEGMVKSGRTPEIGSEHDHRRSELFGTENALRNDSDVGCDQQNMRENLYFSVHNAFEPFANYLNTNTDLKFKRPRLSQNDGQRDEEIETEEYRLVRSARQSDNVTGIDLTDSCQFDINEEIQVNIKEVNESDLLPPRKMRDILMQFVDEVPGQLNGSALKFEEDKQNTHFQNYLQDVICALYEYEERDLSLLLSLIHQVATLYPQAKVSKQFLEIYQKLESFHSKYNLTLPIRKMFPIEGIFLPSKDPQTLFHYVLPKILESIDENNVIKVSKFIHLAFKSSSFEQELIYEYLCVAFEKYSEVSDDEVQELSMQKQRLVGLIDRVQINTLFARGNAMLKNMTSKKRRREIAEAIKECFRKKKKEALAEEFEEKI